MYKSPIEIVNGGLQTQIEGEILRAVQKVDVVVDKDELMRALAYDRDQYQKGFWEGVEIVRRWISVEEMLPDANVDVLVVYEGGAEGRYVGADSIMKNGEWVWAGEDEKVTHWMPLPEPPREE